MRKIFIIIIIVLSALFTNAQQDAMFTHYMDNTLAINPGYAGSRDALTVMGLHRSQWVGFSGAPTTQTVLFHSPILNKKTGIGLSMINDKIGPTSTMSFYLDFSYKIKLTKRMNLAFGLKGGFNRLSNDINALKLGESQDNAFTTNFDTKFMPNFGAGLYLFTDKYYVGLSSPKILENNYSSQTITTSDVGGEARHYFLIAGYAFRLNQDFVFKPTTFLKVTNAAPMEVDITAQIIFMDKIWGGLMFRTGDAAGALIGFSITDQFDVGYSFDWSYVNTTMKYNGGSHEIMLRYDFIFETAKIKSPRYF